MKLSRRLTKAVTIPVAAAAMMATIAVTPATATPAGQKLTWGACPELTVADKRAECATFKVPVDYSKPQGKKLTITMSRIPAEGGPSQRRGVIAGNPGGPGGSALGMFASSESMKDPANEGQIVLPKQLRNQYDLIAVQPRGHAHAGNVTCDFQGLPGTFVAQAGPAAFYHACESSSPGVVQHITTANTARDLDVARRLLGEEQLNLYGVSYGGALMSTYATMFPHRTNHTILDSSIAPSDVWFQLGASRLPARREALNAYFQWIADRDHIYHLGKTPLQVYRKWAHRINREVGRPAEVTPPPAKVGDLPAGLKQHKEAALPLMNQVLPVQHRTESFFGSFQAAPGVTMGSPTYQLTVYGALYNESSWDQTAKWLRDGLPKQMTNPKLTPKQIQEIMLQVNAGAVVERAILCNENATPAHLDRLPQHLVNAWTGGDIMDVVENGIATGQVCAGWPKPRPFRPVTGTKLEKKPIILGYSKDNAVTGKAIHEVQRVMGGEKIVIQGRSHGVLVHDTDKVADRIVNYFNS
ncbi:alpha/beta fold hydrolase [Corynebacterium ulceribovis]|uniref:alpha/beta fold hydrolase n=1 Tax=Corynebacterium ulceribovis TaxID=487732 RepID=UPI00037C8343|nr:alpha/beta fold hydrolase [Corynebacterium ulceribovis]